MDDMDFTPLVILAYVGIATIVGLPVAGIVWLVWRWVR